ncbi:MAG: hypothetical protein NTW50_04875 [Candidatus Berkelbacteria bacterium]|nr:hypothetical protein [Candidatus Berkelbacteria bacterium]
MEIFLVLVKIDPYVGGVIIAILISSCFFHGPWLRKFADYPWVEWYSDSAKNAVSNIWFWALAAMIGIDGFRSFQDQLVDEKFLRHWLVVSLTLFHVGILGMFVWTIVWLIEKISEIVTRDIPLPPEWWNSTKLID